MWYIQCFRRIDPEVPTQLARILREGGQEGNAAEMKWSIFEMSCEKLLMKRALITERKRDRNSKKLTYPSHVRNIPFFSDAIRYK